MMNPRAKHDFGCKLLNYGNSKDAAPSTQGNFIEIRVKGHLNPRWSAWLDGMEVKLLENGDMILSGTIRDQSALLGILNKLHSLNLTLLSFKEIKNKLAIKQILMEISKMENEQKTKSYYEAIIWGSWFIWWGAVELMPFLPKGSGIFGTGIILLSIIGLRALKGLSTSSFSITLGFVTFVWGGLEISRGFVHLPFEIPVFAFTLIALGGFLAIRALLKSSSVRV